MRRDSWADAKQAVCDLIEASGGSLHSKVRLYKAFYYAHLFYWKSASGVLTAHPIVAMPNGPGIDRGDELLSELEREGRIEVGRAEKGPYVESVYRLLTPVALDSSSPRDQAIVKAAKWVRGKSAAQLSEETHEYSRSWNSAQVGEELNIYIDLLDDKEYTTLERRLASARELVEGVFSATSAPELATLRD